ncbi:hypothetical protein RND71_026932 [Anisodus tanguticus]|uniref:Uncharacterized protein n=1 Tax=Anisodus tanguticus TaxID=243964 RepID=A0AAE1RPU4_9SOLA|nr:hypothetical protein RND71_026932 [Anisodus tanguticus]
MSQITKQNLNDSCIQIEILNEKLIKPSLPTPKNLNSYKLSFFDQIVPNFAVPLLYFYPPVPPENSNLQSDESVHKQLQNSLSEILTKFYPLAGRLSEDGTCIECQDQGVIYLEAKVNCQLNEFLDKAYKDTDLVKLFVPPIRIRLAELPNRPMMAIQATMFEHGGLALAVQMVHTLGDGFSGCAFTDEWAKVSRMEKGNARNLQFHSDLAEVFPPKDNVFEMVKKGRPRGYEMKIATRIFMFDEVAISKLKENVNKSLSYSSKVEVVTALIWRSLMRVVRLRQGKNRPSMLQFAMNLRGRGSPKLVGEDQNFFGNFYLDIPIKCVASHSNQDLELHEIVTLIRNAKNKTQSDIANASSEEIFSILIESLNQIREGYNDDEIDLYPTSSLCRFPLNESDFGWAEPIWVSRVNVPFQMFFLMDSKSGIEARVCLNVDDMIKLENDTDIVEFSYVPK